MDARMWAWWVGGVSDGGQEACKPRHADGGSFQGVSVSITNPGGPWVVGDIVSLFDGCGSRLVTVSTVFQPDTGNGRC